MKKAIFMALLALGSFTMVAQTATTEVNTDVVDHHDECCESDNTLNWYVAAGLSMTNTSTGSFESDNYASVELGVMRDNVALGAVFGVSDLNATDHWTELKTAYYFPLGAVDGYLVGGVGTYLDAGGVFIEYGGGVSTMFTDNLGGFAQVSNWDGGNFLSLGATFNIR